MKEIKPIEKLSIDEMDTIVGGFDSGAKAGENAIAKKGTTIESVKIGGIVCNKKSPEIM